MFTILHYSRVVQATMIPGSNWSCCWSFCFYDTCDKDFYLLFTSNIFSGCLCRGDCLVQLTDWHIAMICDDRHIAMWRGRGEGDPGAGPYCPPIGQLCLFWLLIGGDGVTWPGPWGGDWCVPVLGQAGAVTRVWGWLHQCTSAALSQPWSQQHTFYSSQPTLWQLCWVQCLTVLSVNFVNFT